MRARGEEGVWKGEGTKLRSEECMEKSKLLEDGVIVGDGVRVGKGASDGDEAFGDGVLELDEELELESQVGDGICGRIWRSQEQSNRCWRSMVVIGGGESPLATLAAKWRWAEL